MNYKIINKLVDFEKLENEWNHIQKNDSNHTFFSTFDYCKEYVKNFHSKNNQIFVILILHNNEIVAIAPLRIESIKIFYSTKRVIKFLSIGDYNNFLFNESVKLKYDRVYTKVFDALQENRYMWDSISLNLISQKSRLIKYFFKKNIKRLSLNLIAENAFFDISKYDELSFHKSTNRYYNNFVKNIDYKFVVSNDNVVGDISKIHIKQKEFMKQKGILGRRSFYENKKMFSFLNSLYLRNQNVLTYLLIDKKNDSIIGYETGYLYNKTFHSYNIGFNPDYEYYRVGSILKRFIINHNKENKLWKIIDMGPGRYDWKYAIATGFNVMYAYKKNQKKLLKNYISKFLRKMINLIDS